MERQVDAAAGRADARHGGDARTAVQKVIAPAVKREAALRLEALFGASERRACKIADADPQRVDDQSQHAPDTALGERLRDLANERRRLGHPLPGNGLFANRERGELSCSYGAQARHQGLTASTGSYAQKG